MSVARQLCVACFALTLAVSGCAPSRVAAPGPSRISAPQVAPSPAAAAPASEQPVVADGAAPPASVAHAQAEIDEPVEPVTVDVPRDKRVFVVFGRPDTERVFVYFHGRCGDPLAFRAFAKITRPFATFVSFVGDVKCDGGRTKWSDDTGLLDVRVTKALEAVEAARGSPLDKDHLVAIGYSAGALRAEALGTKFPERYPRVILIGAPRAPRAGSLAKSERILIMGGQLDIWMPLAEAASNLAKSGRPARFIEIPGARHGDYGPKAEETMTEAFRWVLDAPS